MTTPTMKQAITSALAQSKRSMTRLELANALGVTAKGPMSTLACCLSAMKRAGVLTSTKATVGVDLYYRLAQHGSVTVAPTPGFMAEPKPTPEPASAADISLALSSTAVAIGRILTASIRQQEDTIRAEVNRIIEDQVQRAIADLPSTVKTLLQAVNELRTLQAQPAQAAPPAPAQQAQDAPKSDTDTEAPAAQVWPGYTPPARKPEAQPDQDTEQRERPKVTVIGLKPGQAHMLKTEYGRNLKLTFLESDDGKGHRLADLSKTSDYVIQMARFSNHATGEHAKKMGANLIEIHGGMTRLRDELTRIYVEHDDKLKATAGA